MKPKVGKPQQVHNGNGVTNHGGARSGAGRPQKWQLDDVVLVGQACEEKWRAASSRAVKARIAGLPNADKIADLYEVAQAIPVKDRRRWIRSEAFEDYLGDLESHLHDRVKTPFDNETGEYEHEAPRHFTVSQKPPKGTRQRIIGEVAMEFKLSANQVDNLWQAYRRFERDLLDSLET